MPVTQLFPTEVLLGAAGNTISFESSPALKARLFDLLSLSTAGPNTGEALHQFLCCLPAFEGPAALTYENVFRVVIVQFLDRFNFCIGAVKRSCIHFVTPKGQIIPFDTYNLFYRDGVVAPRPRETVVA
jgi:hypothetical protein